MSTLLTKLAPNSQISQTFFPPRATFSPANDIPDLSGKIVIVTGANTGIGYQTVRELLLKNAIVYLAARSPSKAAEAATKLKEDTGKVALLLELDLADLHSVRKAAQEFLSKENRLDILFNNAGVMVPPTDQLTEQGYDLQFDTSPPGLKRSTADHGVKARVVNTSSSGHVYAPNDTGIDWAVLRGGEERDVVIKKWGSSCLPGQGAQWTLYGISKMGNILVSNILNRHHGDSVASYSLHPGGIRSDLLRNGTLFEQAIGTMLLHPTSQGALTQLWAGTMPEAESASGQYLIPWARIGEADARAANEDTQQALREYLDEQIKCWITPDPLIPLE